MVHGRAQHYAWGDISAIPDMLGEPTDGQPWAEWWMGTHPMAPSTVDDGTPLQAVAGDLPYLLKLMAAAEPLSLQTHPDQHRAEAGFEREDQLGIPRDSPQPRLPRSVRQAGDAVRRDQLRHAVRIPARSTTRSRCCTRSMPTTSPCSCSTRSWRRPSPRSTAASSTSPRRSRRARSTIAPKPTW